MIKQALIFAAGEAKRMRPLTDASPKPLLVINGQSILVRIINHLIAENVTKIVINGHYKIHRLKDFITDIQNQYPQCEFILSEEITLLETGGGAVKALKFLNQHQPFYIINGDALWMNSQSGRSLALLNQRWHDLGDDQAMLLLLQPITKMPITNIVGDYDVSEDGRVKRNIRKNGRYMFTGIRICHPDLIQGYDQVQFSFLKIMDDAQERHELYGAVHEGLWFNINTPDDYEQVNYFLQQQE